ncbi:MAG: spore coat protein U domain-containing protein [Deltaproteobacteria bacterium]|nr:spore coat protein U domain-containing protein [Deltaproteobacteria bacterium]MBW2254516.1 spore coat protein U domain-containing protein [Deltaproteobacteria bacterium]
MRLVPWGALFILAVLACPLRSGWAKECKISSTPMNFGGYDPLSSTPVTGIGTLDIICNPTHKVFTVTVEMSPGNMGGHAERAMVSAAGGQLFYNVYSNPSYTVVFTTMTRTVTRRTPWTISLYGQVRALQNVPPGLYSDTVTATIFY